MLEVLVAAPALVVRTAPDGELVRVAGRADVAAVGGLAHERLHLGRRTIGFVQVPAVAGAAVDIAILVQLEFRRAAEFRYRHVGRWRHAETVAAIAAFPHGPGVHDVTVVAGETHGRRTGDILCARRQLGEFLDRRDRVGAAALEVADLHRVAGRAVELVGRFLGT
jgi:hypothetical protein